MTRGAVSRPVLVLLAVGVLAAAGFWLGAGPAALPSWFAAWLFWIGLPMGALPLVMVLEAGGGGSGRGEPGGREAGGAAAAPLLPALRAMLPLLPLGTLLALPLLGGLGGLFARPGLPGALPAWWTAPTAIATRDGAVLLVLSLFAILFCIRPRRPRRALAWLGLAASLVGGTLLAVDVVLAPQPALASSLAGLLLIGGQVALAACVAGLLLAVRTAPDQRLPRSAGLAVGIAVAAWLFLQFVQFLVVWSANLPAEAAWYLDRVGGAGAPVVVYAAGAALVAIAALPTLLGRVPVALASVTSAVALALLLVTLLFVLPAYRGRFVLTVADALATVGVGGLLLGVLLLGTPSKASA